MKFAVVLPQCVEVSLNRNNILGTCAKHSRLRLDFHEIGLLHPEQGDRTCLQRANNSVPRMMTYENASDFVNKSCSDSTNAAVLPSESTPRALYLQMRVAQARTSSLSGTDFVVQSRRE